LKRHEHRGVSLGTIVMLALTAAVLGCSLVVLPRLMGMANIRMADRAMLSETNLNDSLPELAMNNDIPIVSNTSIPAATMAPAITQAPTPEIEAAVNETPLPSVSGTVQLTFGGSINLDDLTRKSGYYSDSGKYDFTDNLALIASEMDSDCTLVTLETITDETGNVRQIPNGPHEIMDMLAVANVDMVSLGYNRALERGLDGVKETVGQAAARGLETLGLHDTQEDADRLRVVDIDGVKVAYLHYATAITSTAKRKMNSDSAAFALPMTSISTGAEAVSQDIKRVRENGANIVVVCINWSGSDSINTTSTKMKNFMQALADAGADVIIGAGTKAVKEISWVMGKRADGSTRQTLCAWSLGSLLNGERGNGNVTGMLLHLQISCTGDAVSFERVSYTPTYIWRYKQDDYYRYRVVASDLAAPEGMDESQAANAARAFENLKKTLGNSPVTLRTK